MKALHLASAILIVLGTIAAASRATEASPPPTVTKAADVRVYAAEPSQQKPNADSPQKAFQAVLTYERIDSKIKKETPYNNYVDVHQVELVPGRVTYLVSEKKCIRLKGPDEPHYWIVRQDTSWYYTIIADLGTAFEIDFKTTDSKGNKEVHTRSEKDGKIIDSILLYNGGVYCLKSRSETKIFD
jgi:hypothetical protein